MALSMAAGEGLAPPTTSTSGMRCGGLNGWPMTQRSGCLHLSVTRLISRPDELEAMTTSAGRRRVHLGEQLDFEILVFRTVFLHEFAPSSVGATSRWKRRRGPVAAGTDHEAERPQRRPGGICKAADEGFAVGGGVGGGDLVAAGEEDRRPSLRRWCRRRSRSRVCSWKARWYVWKPGYGADARRFWLLLEGYLLPSASPGEGHRDGMELWLTWRIVRCNRRGLRRRIPSIFIPSQGDHYAFFVDFSSRLCRPGRHGGPRPVVRGLRRQRHHPDSRGEGRLVYRRGRAAAAR